MFQYTQQNLWCSNHCEFETIEIVTWILFEFYIQIIRYMYYNRAVLIDAQFLYIQTALDIQLLWRLNPPTYIVKCRNMPG